MPVNDISGLVESIISQAMGETALAGVNTSSLVSMGNMVLTSNVNVELFLNTLVQRIGRTVISTRAYTNKLADMVLNDFEYGAILQKLKVKMPDVEEDESYNLEDGKSVDHYRVRKPKAEQRFFSSQTPYQLPITIQKIRLKEAFLSESAMSGFIGAIFTEVRNKLEMSLENLGRLCIANFMANEPNTINLLSDYNTAFGKTLTASNAMGNPDFLRYAIRRIKYVMDSMTDMRTDFNKQGFERHTPVVLQRARLISDFMYALETTVDYAAFNDQYIRLRDGYSMMNFWQNPQNPYSIQITPATYDGVGTEVTVENIVGVIYDRDALGIYKQEEEVETTPINAAGLYYNTFWHAKQLWFNDTSENFVMFTLN